MVKNQPIHNDLVLRAARGEQTERTPVWLMRQAGRFDPAYRRIREQCGLHLEEMFQTADLAAEITLLPQRFGVDALIFFQDILTLTTPMGAPFIFRPGPVLERPMRSLADVEALRTYDPEEELPFVPETIRYVKNELAGSIPLLGFAGSPLTVAAFMIEGRSPGSRLDHTRTLMRDEPAVVHSLLHRLARLTARYLRMQVRAGVDAVQLFESIGDLLTDEEYETFAHPYHRKVFQALGPDVPRILFVKERSCLELMAETGADVISVGASVDIAAAQRRIGARCTLQGNVDNQLLVRGTKEQITTAVEDCIRSGGHHGHILNLNHGLLKDTPVENVQRLIDTCHTCQLGQVA